MHRHTTEKESYGSNIKQLYLFFKSPICCQMKTIFDNDNTDNISMQGWILSLICHWKQNAEIIIVSMNMRKNIGDYSVR